ncbi:MAG: hypothetical protein KIT58_00110 [Planctomycetota bacterium]|nr:hypothetical protein [Planctomycetota bacterium]
MTETDRITRNEKAQGEQVARVQRLTHALREGDEAIVIAELLGEVGDDLQLELAGLEVEGWAIAMGHVRELKSATRSREKAWTATVAYDPAAPGGLRREFWSRGGERGMVRVPDGLEAGDVVEVALDDSRGGSKGRDYYRVLARTDDALLIAGASKPGKGKGADVEVLRSKALKAYVRHVEETPERQAREAAERAAREQIEADVRAAVGWSAGRPAEVGPLVRATIPVPSTGMPYVYSRWQQGWPGTVKLQLVSELDDRGYARAFAAGVEARAAKIAGLQIVQIVVEGERSRLLVPVPERVARALGLEAEPMPADPAAEARAELERLERELEEARRVVAEREQALAAARERLAAGGAA